MGAILKQTRIHQRYGLKDLRIMRANELRSEKLIQIQSARINHKSRLIRCWVNTSESSSIFLLR